MTKGQDTSLQRRHHIHCFFYRSIKPRPGVWWDLVGSLESCSIYFSNPQLFVAGLFRSCNNNQPSTTEREVCEPLPVSDGPSSKRVLLVASARRIVLNTGSNFRTASRLSLTPDYWQQFPNASGRSDDKLINSLNKASHSWASN